jgi:hypothetical protein
MMDRFGIVYNRFLLRPLPLNSHRKTILQQKPCLACGHDHIGF